MRRLFLLQIICQCMVFAFPMNISSDDHLQFRHHVHLGKFVVTLGKTTLKEIVSAVGSGRIETGGSDIGESSNLYYCGENGHFINFFTDRFNDVVPESKFYAVRGVVIEQSVPNYVGRCNDVLTKNYWRIALDFPLLGTKLDTLPKFLGNPVVKANENVDYHYTITQTTLTASGKKVLSSVAELRVFPDPAGTITSYQYLLIDP